MYFCVKHQKNAKDFEVQTRVFWVNDCVYICMIVWQTCTYDVYTYEFFLQMKYQGINYIVYLILIVGMVVTVFTPNASGCFYFLGLKLLSSYK